MWGKNNKPPEEREQAVHIIFNSILVCTRNNLYYHFSKGSLTKISEISGKEKKLF